MKPTRERKIAPRPARPSRQALTLVELLLALGIVAILLLLVIPAGGSLRTAMDRSRCLHNLRNWGIAYSRYAADNNSILPPAQMPLNPQDQTSRMVGWDERLAPYVPYDYEHLMKQSLDARRKSIMTCPAEKEVLAPGDYTYAQNIDLNYRLLQEKALVRLTTLDNISQYVVMSDSYRSLTLNTASEAKLKTSIMPERNRHGNHPNFLYADGHAEPFTARLIGYNEVTPANRDFYNRLWFARGLAPHLR